MKQACLLVLAVALFVGIGAYALRPVPPTGQSVLTTKLLFAPGGLPLSVEIADSGPERERGLSDRDGLERDGGMLFLFDKPEIVPFWMKDMRFSIDIVYLSDGIVTQVFADVLPPRPGERPKTVVPDAPVDAVLEVFAGESARRGWVPGTRLFIPAEVR